jgi:DNA-binding transcriptional LysR family regulator
MFEFSQLRCFVAVAEELHFHRAAARLHMTQPPLSRQIQLLEQKLGVVLLLRGSRAVRLTPAGEAFLRDARRMLQIAESAALHARRIALGQTGQITIGFTATSGYGFLPRLAALLRRDLPGIELALREMVSQDQMEALSSGQIDLGLLRPIAPRPGIGTTRVQQEPLLLALPRDHDLAGRPELALADLAGEALITYPPVEGRYLHDLVLALFQLSGAVPARLQFVTQTHSILALVGAGLGIALVPEAAARLRPAEVVLRPLQGRAVAMAELRLGWRQESENPACAPVMAMLRREWSAICAGEAGAGPAPEGP